MRKLSRTLTAAIAFAGATLIPQVRAQDAGDYYDPPDRAARLSWVDRNVSFQPGGVDDWVPADLNRPLTTGDRLWTEAGARAEVNLGTAAFRLNGRTNFTFLNLTDGLAQVELSLGTLSVRVRNLASQENIEIDTPQAAFALLQPGEYRIEVNEQGDATLFTVRSGEAEALAGDQVFPIRARDQVRVTEDNRGPYFDRRAAAVADAFDNWCQQRDRREDMSLSARYVSRDIPGYADLDDQGSWSQDPQYSWVWMPRVAADWAPYRDGHWAWIEPWGWTWEDDAPWGYAPFHYGRWVSIRNRWGWVPGPVVARPVYSPAMVAWIGGAGFSIGVSIGGPPVGWFPLGPREVWVPPYRYSPRYIERVNVTNTVIVNRTVINNINVSNVNYMNRNVAGAVTAVPRDVVISGRQVRGAAVRVSPDVVSRGQVGAFAAVAPQRTSVLGGRTGGGAAPPAAATNRRITARATPPPPPVPFAQRQTALQANPGRPLDRAAVSQIEQRQPSRGRPEIRQVNPQRGGGAPQQGKGQSFGQQNGQQNGQQSNDQQKGRGQQGGGFFQGQPAPQAQQPQQPAVIPQPPIVRQQDDRQKGRGQQGGGFQQAPQAQPQVQQPQQPAVIPQPPVDRQQDDRRKGRGQQQFPQAAPQVQQPQQPAVVPQPPVVQPQDNQRRGRGQQGGRPQDQPQNPQAPPQVQPQVQQPQQPAVIPQSRQREPQDDRQRGRGQQGQPPQPAPQAAPAPQPVPTPPQAQQPAPPAAPQPPVDRQKGRGKQDNKDKGKDN